MPPPSKMLPSIFTAVTILDFGRFQVIRISKNDSNLHNSNGIVVTCITSCRTLILILFSDKTDLMTRVSLYQDRFRCIRPNRQTRRTKGCVWKNRAHRPSVKNVRAKFGIIMYIPPRLRHTIVFHLPEVLPVFHLSKKLPVFHLPEVLSGFSTLFTVKIG